MRRGLLILGLLVGFTCLVPAQGVRRYSPAEFLKTVSVSGSSFNADETKILITSDRTGIFNIYGQPVAGGEPEPLTASTTHTVRGISYFPKDDRVLYTLDEGGNELNHVFVREIDGSSVDVTPGKNLKARFLGWERPSGAFFIATNERDPRYFDVYRYEQAGADSGLEGAARYPRTSVFRNEAGFNPATVSHDGRHLCLVKTNSNADNDLFLVDLAKPDADPRHLTPHAGEVSHGRPSFSPDGETLYYTSDEGREFKALQACHLPSGRHRLVLAEGWDVQGASFSRRGRFMIVAVNEDARTRLVVRRVETGERLPLPADATGISFSDSEERAALSLGSDTSPTDVATLDVASGAVTCVTRSLSPAFDEAHLVAAEVIRYGSFDGRPIPALLYRPHGSTREAPAPALVWVHGGPGGQSRAGYRGEIQCLVNHGFAVLAVNNRGSSGYGRTFFHLDDRRHGEDDLQDCIEGRRYLEGLGWVDRERIGIIGGSYGGYMVAAALAFEPDAFDVGVNIFGVTNWLRTLKSIPPWWESFRKSLYQELGDPVIDEARLRRISPLFHAGRIRRPLLVAQGANDPRVLQAESDEIVAAVKKNGVPVEYVLFPDEGHGFRKKANRLKFLETTLAFLDKHLRATEDERRAQLQDARRLERLVGVARIWGAIEFLHPWLAARKGLDWDAALIDALPRIRAAESRQDYEAAVQGLLDALGDPLTHVAGKRPPAPPTLSLPDGPAFEMKSLPDGVFVLTLRSKQKVEGKTARALMAALKELPRAKGLVLDVRGLGPDSRETLRYAYAWKVFEHLVAGNTAGPALRTLRWEGFPQEEGASSGGYYRAFQLRALGGLEATEWGLTAETPLVVLAGPSTHIEDHLLALLQRPRSALVAHPASRIAAEPVLRMTLPEGVAVQYRVGEVINADGTTGLSPERYVAGEDGLTEALSLVRDFEASSSATPASAVAVPRLRSRWQYTDPSLPERDRRVLAAFRCWATLELFFPYRDLLDRPLLETLRNHLPRIESATTTAEYDLAIARMCTHTQDSHVFVSGRHVLGALGSAQPDLALKFVEGAPTVWTVGDSLKNKGVSPGDVVVDVDGRPWRHRALEIGQLRAASTPQARAQTICSHLLAGHPRKPVELTLERADGTTANVSLPRNSRGWFRLLERKGDVVRRLEDGIGYIDLDRMPRDGVTEAFRKLADTKAIIFDMRGYPNGTAWAISSRLRTEDSGPAALFHRPTVTPVVYGDLYDGQDPVAFLQTLPPPVGPRYTGRTVMLIDETSISQSEHTGLFLKAAAGTTFVGTPTNGANGDVTSFMLPGNLEVSFTGQSVRHPDGRQLQRKGLVPDVEVAPTRAGLRAGKDEVLDAAVKWLRESR